MTVALVLVVRAQALALRRQHATLDRLVDDALIERAGADVRRLLRDLELRDHSAGATTHATRNPGASVLEKLLR